MHTVGGWGPGALTVTGVVRGWRILYCTGFRGHVPLRLRANGAIVGADGQRVEYKSQRQNVARTVRFCFTRALLGDMPGLLSHWPSVVPSVSVHLTPVDIPSASFALFQQPTCRLRPKIEHSTRLIPRPSLFAKNVFSISVLSD